VWLENWRDAVALSDYSGVVDYDRDLAQPSWVWTSAISVARRFSGCTANSGGCAVGIRTVSRRLPGGGSADPGPNRMRVRVTNTLGARYGRGRPTFFDPVGQAPGGLYGPVRVRPATSARDGGHRRGNVDAASRDVRRHVT
jgi:hypothetical protein